MKLKHIYKVAIILLTGLVSFDAEAYLQSLSPTSFNDMYWMAAKGDVSALNAARARGLNIDSVNANGDTGLCLAARYRNQTAYRSFLRAGANPSHPCTWNVSGYEDFKLSVMTNNVRNADTARVATYPGKAWSWKTKALIGVGVVAAGAGTAIALAGGGGGGGGHKHSLKCEHGYAKDNVCICDFGYGNHGDTKACYKDLTCVNGTQVKDVCACNTGYGGTLCDKCASGYGKNSSGVCEPKSADVVGNSININYNKNGDISLSNNKYANMYGLFYDAGSTYKELGPAENEFVNAYKDSNDISDTYTITLTKNGDGEVYGMYSKGAEEIYNTYLYIPESEGQEGEGAHPDGTLTGKISLTGNTVNPMYGIYGNGDIHNADYNLTLTVDKNVIEDTTITANIIGTIQAINGGSGGVYGIYNNSSTGTIYNENKSETVSEEIEVQTEETSKTVTTTSEIKMTSSVISSSSNGNAYGLYSKGSVVNSGTLYSTAVNGSAYGITYGGTLTNSSSYSAYTSNGNSYGAYALQGSTASTNSARIYSYSGTKGHAYGVYLEDSSALDNTGTIYSQAKEGNAYGVYAINSAFTHSGNLDVDSLVAKTTTGDAFGIYASGEKSVITNTSNIKATTTNGNAFGIYNVGGTVTHSSDFPTHSITVSSPTNGSGYAVGIYSDGGTVTNDGGRINVTGPADKSYGIYATNGATIINQGQFVISVNNDQLSFENAPASCIGTISETCYAPQGAKAIYIDKTSTLINAGQITSAKSLSLNRVVLAEGGSVSAPIVEGEAEVSTDVVSSGFNENYVMEKAVVSPDTSALTLHSNSVLFNASLEGEDIVLSKKAFSDITENQDVAGFLEKNYAAQNNEALFKVLKESETLQSFNGKLDDLMGQDLTRFAFEDLTTIKELDFEISEKMLENKDPVFHLSGTTTPHFFENNNGSKSTWGLSGKNEGNKTFGVGAAFTNISSQDKNNDNTRRDQMFQVFMPLSIHQKGATYSVTPRMGYSYGTYERDGFEGEKYDGKIEKRILGVSSSASYKFQKNQFWIAPRAEFNTIGYRLKGHEEDKRFALKLEKQNVLSVEGGVGVQFGYNKEFSKENRLKINNSLMMYHEFADPYELELSLQGMNGTYRLRDEKRRDERIAIQNGLEFEKGNLSFYANIFSYIDSEYKLKTNAGFKYGF